MGLIALASAKGSPGTTTAALALAALWPYDVLLADCDPAGGDIALRMTGPENRPLNPDRGLLSLAAAGRKGLSHRVVNDHTQLLDGGLPALMGLRSAEQLGGLGTLWEPLSEALAQMPGDVIADCGRIGPQGPQMAIVRAADLVILVCRANGSSVAHMRDRLVALTQTVHGHLGVIVVAGSKERAAVDQVWEVVDRMGLPNLHRWHLAYDPAGAAFFDGMGHGSLVRTLLVRTARDVAGDISENVVPPNLVLGSVEPTGRDEPPRVTQAPLPGRAAESSVAPDAMVPPNEAASPSRTPGRPGPAAGAQQFEPEATAKGAPDPGGEPHPVPVGATPDSSTGHASQGRRGAHSRDVAADHPAEAAMDERR